jgi:hypothetical protein
MIIFSAPTHSFVINFDGGSSHSVTFAPNLGGDDKHLKVPAGTFTLMVFVFGHSI